MHSAALHIGDWLGLPRPASESQILRAVEARLPPVMIQRLLALGLTRPEINAVVIPARTLQHRRSRREKLTVEESDRVLRLLRVLALAAAVYGSRDRALFWLRSPHPRLDGRVPLPLLATDTGSRIVEELLLQIDEGMFT